MAKRKRSKKGKIRRIRSKQSFFKQSEARTLEEYLLASIITGTFLGIGSVIGSVLGKYLLKEIDRTVPLPESFHSVVSKE